MSSTGALASTRRGRRAGWAAALVVAAAVAVWLAVQALSGGGTDISIVLPAADGVGNGTAVVLRGVHVGKVTDVKLTGDRAGAIMDARMDDSVEDLLVSGSKFYLENAGSGDRSPTLVLVPGSGMPARQFVGIAGLPPKKLALPVIYSVSFTGPVGALQIGSPVRFRGFDVGEIENVSLSSDAKSGLVTTDVELALDVARFHIVNAADSRDALTALLEKLVHKGLRARLVREPQAGPLQVVLEMVPNAPPAALVTSGVYQEIPAADDGGAAIREKGVSFAPRR